MRHRPRPGRRPRGECASSGHPLAREAARRWLGDPLLALAVLAMAVGIVTMHTIGAGHHRGLASPAGLVAAAGGQADLAGHAEATSAARSVENAGCPGGPCAAPAASAGLGGVVSGIGSVCLAVLPVALLILRRFGLPGVAAARHRVAGPPPRALPQARGSPFAHLRPSLATLCVLRT